MKVRETGLGDVLLLELEVFADERGSFLETWNERRYRAAGLDFRVAQSNLVRSRRGALRGLHFQVGRPQAKLLGVVRGEVFDVAVDVRRGSPSFGRWYGCALSEANRRQLFVPEGYAHGYYVLSEVADVIYHCSDVYDPAGERGIRWDDPAVGVAWPPGERVLSAKDAALPLLGDAELPSLAGQEAGG